MFTEIKAAVERLREVGAKATPGPWMVEQGTHSTDYAPTVWGCDQVGRMLVCKIAGAAHFDFANADAIASTPLLMPLLSLLAAQSDYIEAMQSGTELAGKWEGVDKAAKAFLQAVRPTVEDRK